MSAAFEYATVRVVPRVERDEFVNVGIVVYSPTRDFLECLTAFDPSRVRAIDPDADVGAIGRHLEAFVAVCRGQQGAGPIAAMPLRERYHWLMAPRSTTIQTSGAHAGVAEDLPAAAARLLTALVG